MYVYLYMGYFVKYSWSKLHVEMLMVASYTAEENKLQLLQMFTTDALQKAQGNVPSRTSWESTHLPQHL